MSLLNLNHTLEKFGRTYLIVDVNCLFVAASLREEIWLYGQREDAELLEQIKKDASDFTIRAVDPDRELVSYSGGEQAILACLLLLAFIRANKITNIRLLLCGVLESISSENRKPLKRFFHDAAIAQGLSVYHRNDNQVEELTLGPCTS